MADRAAPTPTAFQLTEEVSDLKAAAALETQSKGYVPDEEELVGSPNAAPKFSSPGQFLKAFVWEGGTKYDGFLTVAAAQVGQVMLTLPHSLAETGMIPGIILQLVFAGGAIWTLYLLLTLYLELKKRSIMKGTWYDAPDTKKRSTVTQYHNLIFGLVGSWSGYFTLTVVIVTSIGTCLPQIVASSTNLYRITTALNKRDLELIFGGAMVTLATIVPDFKNARAFTFYALVATTFTTWYMMATSWSQGFAGKGGTWTRSPDGNLASVFDGVSNILFTFGGHYMLLEVVDTSYEPGKFVKVFAAAYPYILTLTLPNSILTYWAFPDTTIANGNAFGIYPASGWRTASIVLMIGHQAVAFMLFILPLEILFEKLIRTHQKPWYIRLPSRLPVSLFILFLAVAFPFYTIQVFGCSEAVLCPAVINGFLGAFTTSFETFIIPALAYNYVYSSQKAREGCPRPPFRQFGKYRWQITFAINWFIVIAITIIGLGFGIYASIVNFIASIDTFGVFPACYEC